MILIFFNILMNIMIIIFYNEFAIIYVFNYQKIRLFEKFFIRIWKIVGAISVRLYIFNKL